MLQALHNQPFLLCCTLLLFFPALYLELNSQQLLPSGTLPPPPVAEIRHGIQLKPEESQAFTKHQVLVANHTAVGMLEHPLTPEMQNCCAELIFKLVIEPNCSFSINLWNTTLHKSPSNRTTAPVIFRDSFTENTGSAVSCTHADNFLFQMPVFVVDQSLSTFRNLSTTCISKSDFLLPKAGWEVFT